MMISSPGKFYFKYAIFIICHMLIGLAVAIVSLVTLSWGDTVNMWYWNYFGAYLNSKWLLDVDIKLLSTLDQQLDADEPCVIICNHQTSLDQIVFLKCWAPGRYSILAKKSLKYTFTYGLGCIASGVIFIDRKNTSQAREASRHCVKFLEEQKGKLWVYPEGTRSHDPNTVMLPFKKGAFHMAVQAQVPVVPVVISRYRHMYSSSERKFNRVDIKVDVLPKVPTKGLNSEDVTKLTERIQDMMVKRFLEISPPFRPASNGQGESRS